MKKKEIDHVYQSTPAVPPEPIHYNQQDHYQNIKTNPQDLIAHLEKALNEIRELEIKVINYSKVLS